MNADVPKVVSGPPGELLAVESHLTQLLAT